jgi:SAM-dependent methyltransferase
VSELLSNLDERERLCEGCRESVARYSTENMVSRFAQGVLKALDAPTHRGSVWAASRTQARRLAKRVVGLVPPVRRQLFTSTDYHVGAEVADPQRGWSAERAVRRQDRQWHSVVDQALAGSPREDVVALWKAIELQQPRGVIEVGSGHGYLSELMKHVRPDLAYVGLDISLAMCRTARSRNASLPLVVGDAVALPFRTQSVDVVLDAATLMHVPQWRAMLREEARVASKGIILHSVTVSDNDFVIPMRKYAYGVPVFEAVMSRPALVDELQLQGFRIVGVLSSLDYDLHAEIGVSTVSETWVCVRDAP